VTLADATKPETWVRKLDDGPLSFEMQTSAGPLHMIPWYEVIDQPYGVYWVVTPEGSPKHQALQAAEQARREREARIYDRVEVGDETSEREHNLQGEKMGVGPYGGKHWRHAPDGWFSWDLKVLPDQANTLVCEYWGSDVPPRTFDILVNGTLIATQSLNRDRPNEFFEVEYPLPAELTQGKTTVTVRFQAHAGHTAGGVFDCAMLKPKE
jgi:hypothetical protein